MKLSRAAPVRLSIEQVGLLDTLYFQQIAKPFEEIPQGYVDIAVKAVSLNAKDIYTMTGRAETKTGTSSVEFGGIITAVGPGVEHLQPGDRVAAQMPNTFGTIERVPAWSAHKLLPHEKLTEIPTLLTTYFTVLYGLRERAQLKTGESFLIHAGAGALGMAAITFAQSVGAIVYTTTSTVKKKEFLVREFGLDPDHIFNSRDTSFASGIKDMTRGRGVDVVLNSLTGDLMHASWDCMAQFGRFVEVGKKELQDAGKLDMHVFLRGASFVALDITEFFLHENPAYHDLCSRIINDILTLYRSGVIKLPPIAVYDVSDISQAYRQFTLGDRVGKIVVSLENPESEVPVQPSAYATVFDSEKVYLLVGCLGGLGRSLSRWMMTQGARKFVFLGRSGTDKVTAKEHVSRLESTGCTVSVVRGDVSNQTDVKLAVVRCQSLGPLGGVVQASMGLDEALFCRMKNQAWQAGIRPKWLGTWNLHNALEGQDQNLDFFLLTSSVSGSVGTATESNYCAANGFLDNFARWRRMQGKPAVSVGLGMISDAGYLHENPEIEALLLRKGIQPLSEDEFLQVIDLALSRQNRSTKSEDTLQHLADAHILTGLEPFALRKLRAQGFDVGGGTLRDSRTSILSHILEQAEGGMEGSDNDKIGETSMPWLNPVALGIREVFKLEQDALSLYSAILQITKKRFASLILIQADLVDEKKPLAQFGVDSMIAAEFRTWFWMTFKVNVPFLDLLSSSKSLSSLAEFVESSIVRND